MSRSYIYRTSLQIQPLPSKTAPVEVIKYVDDRRRMHLMCLNRVEVLLTVRGMSDAGLRPMVTHRTRPTPLVVTLELSGSRPVLGPASDAAQSIV